MKGFSLKGEIMYKKVFQLGLSRTGTSSFHSAVKILGFKARHYPRDNWEKNFRRYEVLSDIPVLVFMKMIIKRFPKEKYVVTVRDFESWLKSVTEFHARRGIGTKSCNKYLIKCRRAIFGSKKPTEKDYIKSYHKQYNRIYAAIEKYKLDHVVMDILCPFLGKDIPDIPFPRKNARKD